MNYTRIKRFLPDTMYGQLLLIIFLGIMGLHLILLTHAISIGNNYYSRSFISDRARYILTKYALLNSIDKEARINIAKQVTADGSEITFVDTKPDFQTSQNENSQEMIYKLYALIDNVYPFLNDNTILAQVSEINRPDFFVEVWRDLTEPSRYKQAQISPEGLYEAKIAIPFQDGTWVIFIDKAIRSFIPRPFPFVPTLAILFFLAFFCMLLVYKAMQPLKLFTHAAENFAVDIPDIQPLEVKGPREVRETILAFNQMQQRIVNFVEERSRLLAAISHDLRTPLTRMALRVEQLNEPFKSSFTKDITELRQLMDTSIDLARATANTEQPAPLDVISLLESMVDDMVDEGYNIEFCDESTQANKNFRDTDNQCLEVPPIIVRPLCLKRALSNLLNNSVRYATHTRVCVCNTRKELTISVNDNGPGIPESMREQVFEPFFRLEPSRSRETGGTGLGLAIARTMVRLCNGSLRLSQAPEGGLQATITFLRKDHKS